MWWASNNSLNYYLSTVCWQVHHRGSTDLKFMGMNLPFPNDIHRQLHQNLKLLGILNQYKCMFALLAPESRPRKYWVAALDNRVTSETACLADDYKNVGDTIFL